MTPRIVLALAMVATSTANAQSPPAVQPAAPPAALPAAPVKAASAPAVMDKKAAHYVEGPGYVTFFHKETKGYAGTYAECERNCLADARCRMIEFYKPLRKCHLYDHTKWNGTSRDADVALKRGG